MTSMDSSPHFASHHDLLSYYHRQYDADVQSGKFQAFTYPFGAYGAAVVVAYLLIPHRHSPFLRRGRYLVFAFMVWFAVYTVARYRARNMACAFGVGLVSAWMVLWSATLLVVHDAQLEFQRIERTEGPGGRSTPSETPKSCTRGLANGQPKLLSAAPPGNGDSDGDVTPKVVGKTNASIVFNILGTAGPVGRMGDFAWQPFPVTPFVERLDWVADIFCSFRGMGWNWRISGLAPPPKWVQEQLRESCGTKVSTSSAGAGLDGTRGYQTLRELVLHNLWVFVVGYLSLDVLKVTLMHDRYFWGYIDAAPPAYLPAVIRTSPALLRLWRLNLTQLAIKAALETIFSLGPLFFAGVLGTKRIGARGEPWMYPDTFGSYKNVFDKGLAGWWGGWWHQTFRFAFASPSKKMAKRFGLDPRSLLAKALQSVIAFSLSGMLHACGSMTQLGDTSPLCGPFLFFFLQPFGIMAEAVLTRASDRLEVRKRLPTPVRYLFTWVYVHAWFYYTAPLLCDDFAKGGLWLFEPVPVSPLRALGFGSQGEGWWCWGGNWFVWHRGKRWWSDGLRL